MATRWRWPCLAVAAVALGVWGYDRTTRIFWLGHTDLEVEFVVADADTGEPVEGADVVVESVGGWYADEDQRRDAGGFVLRTSAGGSARRSCRDSWVIGADSGLGFSASRSVRLPRWWFRVSAPGYLATESSPLDEPEYRRAVQRMEPRADRLEVRVRLQRRPAEPHAAPDAAR